MDTALTNSPLISVIMPAYNAVLYIGTAIESILAQSEPNFELIIIDDCSTDKTLEVISTIKDSRIVLIKKESNSGYTISLNMGIKIAKGSYIARMDADDISHPTRFVKQLAAFSANLNLIVCGTWYTTFSSVGNNMQLCKHPVTHNSILVSLLLESSMAHPTVMIAKNRISDAVLNYDISKEPAEDYHLWVKLINYGEFYNIPESLLRYRVHPTQTSEIRKIEQQKSSLLAATEHFKSLFPNYTGNLTDFKIIFNKKVSNFEEYKKFVYLLKYLNCNAKPSFRSQLLDFTTHLYKDVSKRYLLGTELSILKKIQILSMNVIPNFSYNIYQKLYFLLKPILLKK